MRAWLLLVLLAVASAAPPRAYVVQLDREAVEGAAPGAPPSAARPFERGVEALLVRLDAAAQRDHAQRLEAAVAARGAGATVAPPVFNVTRRYGAAVPGFAAVLSDRVADLLRASPEVALVEPDLEATIAAQQSLASGQWNLDRIDARARAYDGIYAYDGAGAGVNAYVVDTGIYFAHPDFQGRAAPFFDAFGGDGSDANGHGTHVAGTIGGAGYGVAKAVRLHSVRVLDGSGSGTASGLLAGLDAVAASGARPAVVSMSLGFGAIVQTVDDAVQRLTDLGYTVVVAAGNSNADACGNTPARAPAAVTVGATDSADVRASYSNYGACLDLFAPGSNVLSAWHVSPFSKAISGTSMAAPAVSGAAALYLEADPAASPGVVAAAVVGASTTGLVASAGAGSPNRLLYARVAPAAATPTPTPGASPTPAPNPCGSTTLATCATVLGTNVGAPDVVAGRTGEAWYWLTVPTTGTYRVSTCFPETNFDTFVSVYRGGCPASTSSRGVFVASADDGCAKGSKASLLTVSMTAGETYVVAVEGARAGRVGNFALRVAPASGTLGATCPASLPLTQIGQFGDVDPVAEDLSESRRGGAAVAGIALAATCVALFSAAAIAVWATRRGG